jgi:two-component system, LuxR family, sensor kinase FixL
MTDVRSRVPSYPCVPRPFDAIAAWEDDSNAEHRREQQTEFARVSAYARAGAMGMALAHEISQPLSTVAIYLHAARRMLQSGAARAPVLDALSMAEMEAQRTREVLERIQDFVSSGKLDLKPLDLSNLTLKIGTLCREEAAARGIHV